MLCIAVFMYSLGHMMSFAGVRPEFVLHLSSHFIDVVVCVALCL